MITELYFVLGGKEPEQGCVITKDRINGTDIWELGKDPNATWYLYQSLRPISKISENSDPLSKVGYYCMDKLGETVLF